jgi:hypothetical protein|tara:strand:+ start:5869 stop:6513 length:645 start_codon:yes stop_codon:yes gene_type:complete
MKTFKELRLEAVMSTWTVTVQKPVNKLKKGDKQTVKARSGFEAINKAMKLWKDPALRAASADSFKITKEGLEEAAKVDPKAMAADIPQMKLSTFLKKASRKPKVYFDGADLVDLDKTVVRGALDPKKKITVQKLIDALTEAADPKVAKAVQGLNDLGNKMKGRDQKDVRRIEKLYRSGNNKLFQGAIRALDTDLRDQVKDIFDALGMVDKGVIG